jgi:hypothetical protein
MFINVKINGRNIKGLVDTGSEITMIADKLANDLGLVITKYKGKQINGVNSQPVEITGQTQVNVVIFDANNERSIPITAVTVRDFHLNFLLGYDFHFASKSLIDIYHNNIVFNSAAVKTETNAINVKPLGQKDINRMHSIENVEVPPNGILYAQRNTSLCAVHYVGPQTVVYDAERDCVTALHQITQSSQNLILMPSSANCQKNIPEAITKRYWKIDHCDKREFVVDEEIIQVKGSDKFNYIYCNSLNISTYNRSLVCPDYVFAVPNNAPFSINSIIYPNSWLHPLSLL